ncbi:DNA processing protein DprA [Helicobacter saguini]|uniref:DNA processing protein DprA n=1 Tax=Helicobacter saguini TaxID=1548018 RepID=A0A347VL01_9HELI|nr:DNA-processing protein DprA [Helicobacter saguini]MWV61363.1 DNA processing protein DprA [Helicobacter saguini]MWV67967.1 DNA processing protein DprA [Helicobacter saguini]MWV70565.1 DNA processing protein DprA [Helicobacter saguini]MWV72469.1 DNA processing protein DprA [Helicobacter saguini]TLD94778.1 DNA processing protein DprA [Helicobacter saguini]
MPNSYNSTFFDIKALESYISKDKLKLLNDIPNIAKRANLSSKHLYKEFKGLHISGNLELFKAPKVAIIGTRSPNQYTKHYTATLSRALSNRGFIVVSGGAIGVDSIAHTHSDTHSIMVLPCGLNVNYPKENARLIESKRRNALVVSEYERDFMPHKYSFLERNRIIIALSDFVIIPQADLQSGSMSSANLCYALNLKPFVLPHRLGESLGTQDLLSKNRANCIYNTQDFITQMCENFGLDSIESSDEILDFARNNGLFSEALRLFGERVLEYELQGKITRNGLYISTSL